MALESGEAGVAEFLQNIQRRGRPLRWRLPPLRFRPQR